MNDILRCRRTRSHMQPDQMIIKHPVSQFTQIKNASIINVSRPSILATLLCISFHGQRKPMMETAHGVTTFTCMKTQFGMSSKVVWLDTDVPISVYD